MSFEPRSFLPILSSMVSAVRANTDQLTDFNPGGVTRTWLEAAALALDELWWGTAQGIADAIPEAAYLAFGFERLPAVYALGTVTFSLKTPATAGVSIPAGTTVHALGSAGIQYITVESATLAAGQTSVQVPVRASGPGADYNVAAGALTALSSLPGAGLSVTNELPIQSGRDAETDSERRLRFAAYILTLARGTVAALDYAARSAALISNGAIVEQVRHVAMAEMPGIVDLYVHNGAGRTSADLVAAVRAIIEGGGGQSTPGWRAAGVEVRYHAMADVPVSVTGVAQVAAGYTAAAVHAHASGAVDALFRSFQGSFLPVPAIRAALYSVPGLLDVVLEAPAMGINFPPWQRPVLGGFDLGLLA